MNAEPGVPGPSAARDGVATTTWRAVVEGALDAVVIADEQGVVTGWNPQAEVAFGWRADEAVGRKVADLIVPESHRDGHLAGWDRYLRTGVPHIMGQRIELAARHRDGHTLPVELTVSTHDVDGHKVFSAAIRDITDRLVAQAHLDRQTDGLRVLTRIAADREQRVDRQLHRALVDSLDHLGMDAALVTRRTAEGEQRFSEAGETVALRTIAAAGPLPASDESDASVTQTRRADDLRSCCAAPIVVHGATFGDVRFWSREPHEPLHAEVDHDFVRLLGGWLGAALEREAAMVAQRDSEEGIRALQQTSADGRISLEQKVEHLLSIACSRFSMDTGVLAARQDDGFEVLVASGTGGALATGDVLPAHEALSEAVVASAVGLAIEDTHDSAYRDHPACTKHGLRAYIGVPVIVDDVVYGTLSVSAFRPREPFQSTEGEYLRLLAQWVGRELENRHNTEALAAANRELEELLASTRALAQEAEAASRAKSDFLAVMSHEMRTPMNGVLGILDLLEQDDMTADQRAQVRLAADSGRSLVALIDDILDFSRIEAGKVTLEPVRFGIADLLTDVVGLIGSPAVRRGIEIDIHIGAELPDDVVGPELRIRQVLGNLVGNAVKFTERGLITVSADVVADGEGEVLVRYDVVDTGIGVPERLRPELFEPFTQGDASSTRRHGGTGLGLAISRRLVQHMGGHIGYEPLDTGSSFWFEVPLRLPVALEPRRERPATRTDYRVATDRTVRVLVVEDHPINQAVTMRLLERLGHEVHLAENGEEALERLDVETFDVVLMDCRMPVLDGYAATRELRRREATAGTVHTPVIALTANALPEERQRCLEAGMDDYLAKPIAVADIELVIDRWLAAGEASARGEAAPSGADGSATFDPARLKESSGGDAALAAELIETLTRESRSLMDRMLAAEVAGDQDGLADAAHALKGSAATLGFTSLAAAAAAVEAAAKADADTAPLLKALEARLSDPARVAAAGP
jgi:PAS domain S-box-containing protein